MFLLVKGTEYLRQWKRNICDDTLGTPAKYQGKNLADPWHWSAPNVGNLDFHSPPPQEYQALLPPVPQLKSKKVISEEREPDKGIS